MKTRQRIHRFLSTQGFTTALLFSLNCGAAEGLLMPGEKPCLSEAEHAQITLRHSELGMRETQMGCDAIREFQREIYLEKRALHLKTVDGSMSNEDYSAALEEISKRENAQKHETQKLRENCAVPAKERIALKREVLMRGRCAALPPTVEAKD